ncbi:hypothetical protein OIU76_013665 [Salix suchowensis]|nr:hypothetical protein OIU76_013665 [Salix suchowensis]
MEIEDKSGLLEQPKKLDEERGGDSSEEIQGLTLVSFQALDRLHCQKKIREEKSQGTTNIPPKGCRFVSIFEEECTWIFAGLAFKSIQEFVLVDLSLALQQVPRRYHVC